MSQKQKIGDSETPKDKTKGFVPADDHAAKQKAAEARELIKKMEADKKARESSRRGCCGCC